MQFERSTRKPRPISLTSLIDVVFLLLFFFMLSSSFVRTESMELSFPASGEVTSTAADAIRIFIVDDEKLFLGNQEMSVTDLKAQLRLILFENPERNILLMTGEKTSVQRLVALMDDIYLMGGKYVSVSQGEMENLPSPAAETEQNMGVDEKASISLNGEKVASHAGN